MPRLKICDLQEEIRSKQIIMDEQADLIRRLRLEFERERESHKKMKDAFDRNLKYMQDKYYDLEKMFKASIDSLYPTDQP